MNTPQGGMPEVDPTIPENAVSLYGQNDAMDEFPVLKAFQQYIDAEQTKARKRMIVLCVSFCVLMFIVIAVFGAMLMSVNARNQAMSDRLLDYAMRDKERLQPAASVAAPGSENAVLTLLTGKMEEMQRKLEESQTKAEKALTEVSEQAKKAADEEDKKKRVSAEQLEIERLKALLSAEKEKQAAERERLRQIELEEYRRKHYPELYEVKKPSPAAVVPSRDEHKALLDEVDQILKEGDGERTKPVRYFDDEEEPAPSPAKAEKQPQPPSPPPEKKYSIPVEIQGSSSTWSVPND